MSEKEYKKKCETMFSKNTVLLNRIKELEKEISVLLSCSNCPENKGGYICVKEYNDKCLAQKIQYIKELEEQIEKLKCCGNCFHFSEHGDCEDCDGKNSAWEPEK